jgi:hypothetical protein
VVAAVFTALASCGEAPMRSVPAADEAPAFRVQAAEAEVGASAPAIQAMWAEQKLIRTADLGLQVEEVPAAVDRVDSAARRHDGFVADRRVTRHEGDRQTATLTIRVPADRFDGLLEELRGLGDVRTDAVGTEDVTRAYADLETRLAVKEETAARLRRLLAERSGQLADVLAVERELSRVVTELEQLKGERRYYDQRIAVSTINVSLFEPGALLQPGAGAPIAEALGRALHTLSWSVSWLIYLVTFLAPWLAVGALGWWLVRSVRRRAAPGGGTETRPRDGTG